MQIVPEDLGHRLGADDAYGPCGLPGDHIGDRKGIDGGDKPPRQCLGERALVGVVDLPGEWIVHPIFIDLAR